MAQDNRDDPVCLVDCKAILGEGPVWVAREQALYWVDIHGRKIFRRDFASGDVERWETPLRVGSIAPRAAGGFIAGTDKGFALVDPGRGEYEILTNPEPERTNNRFNDGKLDRQGRFWAGTMDDSEKSARGALYCFDADRSWLRADDDYRVTNGPAFCPPGTIMYHTDSARQIIYAFDFGPDGIVSNKRIFREFGSGDGYPDGMTVDGEGHVWVAFWDGWCLRRLTPDGEVVRTVEMPVARPTSCAFGGPNLDHLFVTSARIGLDEKALAMQPYAGGLFVLKPGASGVPEALFAG